jgi:hypothetical protein
VFTGGNTDMAANELIKPGNIASASRPKDAVRKAMGKWTVAGWMGWEPPATLPWRTWEDWWMVSSILDMAGGSYSKVGKRSGRRRRMSGWGDCWK